MMRCQNCFAELRESETIPAGVIRLNHTTDKRFFYIRCPVCDKLWYCKRTVIVTDMEVIQEVEEM